MKISIVIPVYLDTDALPELLDRLFLMATLRNYDIEVILVDDGSPNETWQRLIDIKQAHASKHIVLLRLAQNCGQQAATICGLIHCDAEIAITMDSDLQHPPEEIPALLQELTRQRLDLVYGIPAKSQHPFWRRVGSLALRTAIRPFVPSAIISSAFRALRTTLITSPEETTWQPYLSLDIFLQKKTNHIHCVKVHHAARPYGASTYTWKTLLITAFKALHYFRHSGLVYVMLGLLLVLSSGANVVKKLDIFGVTSDAIISVKTTPFKNIIMLAGGLTLIFLGVRHSKINNRLSRSPMFILTEKIK